MTQSSISKSGQYEKRNPARYEEKLLTLHTHALQLSSARNVDEIVRYTLDAMEFALGFDHADFSQVENGYLRNKGHRGMALEFSELPLGGNGITVQSANTMQTIMARDTKREPSYVDGKGPDWKGEPTMLSELAVPVIIDDRVWAILNVESRRLDAFTSEDKILLETLALHVASDVKRLRQTESLMTQARIVEDMVEGVNVADDNGVIFFTNSAFQKMFGYGAEELIGKHISILNAYPPEENTLIVNEIIRTLRTGRAWHGELRNRRKNGSEFPTSASITALKLRDKEYWVSVQENITERKRTEEKLRQRLSELTALQETVADLSGERDLHELLDRIVKRAARLLRATSGGMYLCDSGRREVKCVVSYNTVTDLVGTVLKYGEGAAGMVAVTGKPLIIDDYRAWVGRAPAFEKDHPFRAVLSVPMIWRGGVSGVIHVLDNSQTRRFTRADQELLFMFANHAAIAVESARRVLPVE